MPSHHPCSIKKGLNKLQKIIITGGKKLKGAIPISGSKNSALPIMSASLLTQEKCVLNNVPDLVDIESMIHLLEELGKKIVFQSNRLEITENNNNCFEASYDVVRKMRASICVLGPLIAKRKKAKVSFPGGCVIGTRPVDLHLKGLTLLGANIDVAHGFIIANADTLFGTEIDLYGKFGSSVLATANIIMAASLARGRTVIHGAACEPEVVDLVCFLKKMGADIIGEGTTVIEIQGKKELKGAEHRIIPDRIETGTYLTAGAITQGDLFLQGANANHLGALISVLNNLGQEINITKDGIGIKGKKGFKGLDIETDVYPGFPTDMQAQIMALLCLADGTSVVSEKIFPDRFMHISELNRMGANILFESGKAIIKGVDNFLGTEVMASDLRASAALVIAGLRAKDTTTISRIYHLDRGYELLEEKLAGVGAEIKRSYGVTESRCYENMLT